ncbi:hypothetical protein CDD80_5685 [Ophiocordyceps camponoti-rufipedis]|uniref:AB hydrolase-1 domain-containing protein n=1 Tax=Ophiocordyceps camponoti-rufipedis TaxID=2004952 RepID=A0A2C5YU53_9HYPO|nr:hypothetical protein CDD80_5685 [Ophiocordyceps camponoti-rufipedis]
MAAANGQPRPPVRSASESSSSSDSATGEDQLRPRRREIISSLITSLSAPSAVAAQPDLLLPSTLSLPLSPVLSSGSFGVDYGAYNHRIIDVPDPVSLDDLAACPPVVRTSKHRPGFLSPSNKTPRSTSHDGNLGLRSLIRSRPSSRGSVASKNDDSRSGVADPASRARMATMTTTTTATATTTSTTSTTAMPTLKYAASSERLRPERCRSASIIREEPSELPTPKRPTPPDRESSLKDASARRRRSARPTKNKAGDIPETNESVRDRSSRRDTSFLLGVDEDIVAPPATTAPSSIPKRVRNRHVHDEDTQHDDDDDDDYDNCAPYPSVSNGRRHRRRRSGRTDDIPDRSSSRLSGGMSPAPVKPRRNSSRLQRRSAGPRSPPRGDPVASPESLPRPSLPERPGSADSVDEEIESYLSSARLSRRIRHPQTGRIVSFSDVGDENGSAVFCCVGMGLTRYITAFYDELAVTLRLRLITPDRPGVGESEPLTDGTATPLGWPDDVYAICQALKITKFSILAHSAGAIYALATALRMPQHIRGRIHLLAPWIPPSQMNVFGSTQSMPPSKAIPTSQKILRALPTPILKAANSSFMTATSSSITSSLPKTQRRGARRKTSHGKDALTGRALASSAPVLPAITSVSEPVVASKDGAPQPVTATENMDRVRPPDALETASPATAETDRARQLTYDTRLTHAIWELATTGANPAVDLLVCLERRHAIGFRYVDITRPVVIHHGSRDTRVPVENVKWLGKMMRRCEVRVLEGEGHGLMASATVMGSVLMEMSKEWEDWIRATGQGRRRMPR